jgi:hypothetical protein
MKATALHKRGFPFGCTVRFTGVSVDKAGHVTGLRFSRKGKRILIGDAYAVVGVPLPLVMWVKSS